MNPLDRVAGWAEDDAPPSEPDFGPTAAHVTSRDFDVEAFIQRHGLKVRRRGEWRGGEKWELESLSLLILSILAGARS